MSNTTYDPWLGLHLPEASAVPDPIEQLATGTAELDFGFDWDREVGAAVERCCSYCGESGGKRRDGNL